MTWANVSLFPIQVQGLTEHVQNENYCYIFFLIGFNLSVTAQRYKIVPLVSNVNYSNVVFQIIKHHDADLCH